MSDYISRQAAIDVVKGIDRYFVKYIEGLPAADVVEVVRCKDCKYSSPNKVYGCRIHSFADDLDERMYSDDFCSFAERRIKDEQ